MLSDRNVQLLTSPLVLVLVPEPQGTEQSPHSLQSGQTEILFSSMEVGQVEYFNDISRKHSYLTIIILLHMKLYEFNLKLKHTTGKSSDIYRSKQRTNYSILFLQQSLIS